VRRGEEKENTGRVSFDTVRHRSTSTRRGSWRG